MTNFGKKIFISGGVLILLLLVLFIWRAAQVFQNEVLTVSMPVYDNATTTVYEAVELKSQKDFSLTGQNMYTGSGFEPGFAFKLNLAGTKFGLDLTSQYGETRYVGYIELTSQSTSTKVFSGMVLDKQDQMQNLKLEIINKKCGMPSGDEVAFTTKISVANEKLTGCAEMKM